jgi:ketosteroid isomerase-like protein
MSQENVEIARRSIDAFSRGNLDAVIETLAPEFELHPSGRFMDTQRVYRGREGWTEFWGDFRAAWEDVAVSIERMEAIDDRVLILGKIHGKGRESGVAVEADAAWVHTVNDGLIVRVQTFATWADALEAAGLRDG